MSEKVYLFKPKGSKITHAVVTHYSSLKWEGAGVLSEIPLSTGHVTCKGCIKKMKAKSIRITKPPKTESWPLEHLRKLDQPRILGIPG